MSFFGASNNQKSASMSMNPVGSQVNPDVGAPVTGNSGSNIPATGVLQMGQMGGATARKGGGSGDVQSDGKHTTGAMPPRLP